MRQILSLLASIFLAGSVLTAAEISGSLRQSDGTALTGATVRVSTARLRTGSSPMCPSCWADCGKSAVTDAKGQFRIPKVDEKLVFRLIAFADGHAPEFIKDVDPAKGPVEATPATLDLSAFPESQVLKGKITDREGKPIAGAVIEPTFPQKGLAPMALANLNGEFFLTCPEKIKENLLDIRAEGYAAIKVKAPVRRGVPQPVQAALGRGVLVTGRVLQDGAPVRGVTMAAAQVDRGYETFVGSVQATTGDDGAFQIMCVQPQDKVAVYGLMKSFAGRGAVKLRVIDTDVEGSLLDIGDLEVQKAGQLAGWLRLADGRPFPSETRINLSRDTAWDARVVDVSPKGRFEVKDVPLGEALTISLPRDCEFSSANHGFTYDKLNHNLEGSVKTERCELKIEAAWKEAKTREEERYAAGIRDQFREYIETAKLSPEQVAAFVSVQRDLRKVFIEAQQTEQEKPLGAIVEEFETREMTKRLGEKHAELFRQYKELRNGREFLGELANAQAGTPLDDAEKQRLAPLVAAVMAEFARHWTEHDWTKAPAAEKLKMNDQLNERLIAAGAQVLPPPKQEWYKACLEVFRNQGLEEIRKAAEEEKEIK